MTGRMLRVLSTSIHPVAAGSHYDIALVLAGPGVPGQDCATVSAAGTFHVPNTSDGDSDSTGHVMVNASNAAIPIVATPYFDGQYAFGGTSEGGHIFAGGNVNSVWRICWDGQGVLTVPTLSWSGGGTYFAAKLHGVVLSTSETPLITDYGTTNESGDTLVVTADDAAYCTYYLDIGAGAPLDGSDPSAMAVADCTWEPYG